VHSGSSCGRLITARTVPQHDRALTGPAASQSTGQCKLTQCLLCCLQLQDCAVPQGQAETAARSTLPACFRHPLQPTGQQPAALTSRGSNSRCTLCVTMTSTVRPLMQQHTSCCFRQPRHPLGVVLSLQLPLDVLCAANRLYTRTPLSGPAAISTRTQGESQPKKQYGGVLCTLYECRRQQPSHRWHAQWGVEAASLPRQ
jgi:hypothetical protein